MPAFSRQRRNPSPLAGNSPLGGGRGMGGYVGANVQYPSWQHGALGDALHVDPAMHSVTKRMPGGFKYETSEPNGPNGAAPGLNLDYGTRGMGEPVFDKVPR